MQYDEQQRATEEMGGGREFQSENTPGPSRHGKQRRVEHEEEMGDGREFQSENTPRPPRHGKQRRVEPFSDKEQGYGGGDGGDGDVPMHDNPNFDPRQRQHEGVGFSWL